MSNFWGAVQKHVAGHNRGEILTGQEHVAGQKKGKKMPGHVLGH